MLEHKDLQDVGRLGRLDLRFGKRDHRTILFDSFSKIPLQAFQPFYPDETGCAYTYIINPTGGFVGGDKMEIRITLDDGTHAFITSPSATKVYRSTGRPSLQDVEVTVKRNSILEYMPGYVIPFSGSIYRQKIKLCMDEGSAAFILDFFTTGRVAMGEHFRFREYKSITEVEYCGKLILSERICLKPDNVDYSSYGFFESFTAMAVVYLVFDNPLIEKSLIGDIRRTTEDMRDIAVGVSTLSSKGVIVRILGNGVRFIERAVLETWSIARRHIINAECPPLCEIKGRS